MSFVSRTYFIWVLAAGSSLVLSWVTRSWLFIPLFFLIAVVTWFVQCNKCGHNAFADAKGDGRILTNSCTKCGASLEDVYPFSYARKKKRSQPPS
jgi:hypothetical protein